MIGVYIGKKKGGGRGPKNKFEKLTGTILRVWQKQITDLLTASNKQVQNNESQNAIGFQ